MAVKKEKNKHLTDDLRLALEAALRERKSLSQIKSETGIPRSTMKREIRRVMLKGESFDSLSQAQVDLMMSHINSYVREASGDKPPYELMTRKFGVEFADLFNIRRIPANDVVLKPSLLGIEQKVRPEILKATDPESNTK